MRWIAVAVAIVLGGLAGFVGGRGIANNGGGSSQFAEPRVVVAVEQGTLTQTVTGQAEVRPETTTRIGAPAVPQGTIAVATEVPLLPGDPVAAGTVLLAVANRPIIAMEGPVPAYRPMTLGARGPDVAQLHEALADLGYGEVWDEAFYDRATARAVAALYRDLGYQPLDADGSEVGETGTDAIVPLGEIVFVNTLPGSVTEVGVTVGSTVDADALVVSSGALTLVGTIATVEAAGVRSGQPAEVRFSDGFVAAAQVVAVPAPSPPGSSTDDEGASPTLGTTLVQLEPTQPLTPDRIGSSGALSITTAVSSQEALTVPITAIHDDGAGNTWLDVVEGDNSRPVDVNVGLSVSGRVVVEATDGSLRVGDQVQLVTADSTDDPPSS
ncbi:MAG: hypothetical protein R2823_07225 [Acidimicrobiia bacterium]